MRWGRRGLRSAIRTKTVGVAMAALPLLAVQQGCADDDSSATGAGSSSSGGGNEDPGTTIGVVDSSGTGSGSGTAGSGDSTTAEPVTPWDGTWPNLECDPIVPEYCGYPFPNNVFTVVDDATPTGRRLAISSAMLPRALNGSRHSPDAINERDGFSVSGTLLAYLPGATATGLPDPLHIGDSILPSSATIVLDVDTGELFPHFTEVDLNAEGDGDRSLMIQPAASFAYGHRYIVAVRGVVDEGGNAIAPSPAFAALRDGTASDEPSVEERRALYGDIFARLDEAGIPRDDLQLAWDFTVSSREHTNGRAVHMRDVAIEQVGDAGPSYEITDVDEDWSPEIFRRIRGTIEVPLFLDIPGTGGVMMLDEDGVPQQNGTASYPFTILVPYSAQNAPAPGVAFGHGLFGDRSQVESGEFQAFANQANVIFVSLDWIGMSDQDPTLVGGIIASGDVSALRTMPDRLQQSFVNFVLALRMMKTSIAEDAELQYMGQPLLDTSTVHYYGGSQGGIMGPCVVALSPDVERGVLAVPGQPYNLLLERSVNFEPFADITASSYEDAFDRQMLLGLLQIMWDRGEPSGYSPHLSRDPLPGTPPHDVLLLVSIGDHQVTTLGAHVMARSIGAVNMAPTSRTIWGLEEARGPVSGSAMIEHDFGLPAEPLGNVPMSEGQDPHGQLAGVPPAIEAVDHFLRTGEVMMFCDGVCDPG
jgi:hypothetical protein